MNCLVMLLFENALKKLAFRLAKENLTIIHEDSQFDDEKGGVYKAGL